VIEVALAALLDAADTSAADRIKPLTLPRDPTLPACTYQLISNPRELSHDGDQGYATFRVQLNCWGKTYKQAKQLAGEARLALNGQRGNFGGVEVGRIQVSSGRDDWDQERELARVILDCTGEYQEAQP
jgi:hypothetical protein